MTAREQPDANTLHRVLDYWATADPEIAQFARLLIDDDCRVLEAWGPEQMAVWHLELQRGNWIVQFHSERGAPEWARVVRATDPSPHWDNYRHMGLAIFAWARANAVPMRFDHPDDLEHDLMAHGRKVLDWLNDGHEEVLERVYGAWYAYQLARHRLGGEAVRALQANAVIAMEAAVVG